MTPCRIRLSLKAARSVTDPCTPAEPDNLFWLLLVNRFFILPDQARPKHQVPRQC